VTSTVGPDRQRCRILLNDWAAVKKELLRHWHFCDQDATQSDLLVTGDGAFWICRCGQVTPMTLSGVRTVSASSMDTVSLPEERRESLIRAYRGR